MTRSILSAEVSRILDNRIRSVCDSERISRSDFVRAAVEQYLFFRKQVYAVDGMVGKDNQDD